MAPDISSSRSSNLQPDLFLPKNAETKAETKSDDSAGLLKHPDLWRAGQLHTVTATEPSSFSILDQHLPGGGWPLGGLCELLLPQAGVGELQLLAPALAQLSTRQRWIVWVNPPFVPYAPALEACGIDASKILLVRTGSHQDTSPEAAKKAAQEALWALERASRSGTCSAALAWLDERHLRPQDTQRLQVAAAKGSTFCCLFRPASAQPKGSMAPLRLLLERPEQAPSAAHHLSVSILKRRGGWSVKDLGLELVPHVPRPELQAVQAQLELWRAERAKARIEAQEARPDPRPSSAAHEFMH